MAAFAADGQGLNLFIQAIPFNFYALLTIFMLVFIAIMKVDYGPMARCERNAVEKGDLFSGENPYANFGGGKTTRATGGCWTWCCPFWSSLSAVSLA